MVISGDGRERSTPHGHRPSVRGVPLLRVDGEKRKEESKMAGLSNLSEQFIVLLFVVVLMLMTPIVFIALDYWAGIGEAAFL